jgi:hypothetical protein
MPLASIVQWPLPQKTGGNTSWVALKFYLILPERCVGGFKAISWNADFIHCKYKFSDRCMSKLQSFAARLVETAMTDERVSNGIWTAPDTQNSMQISGHKYTNMWPEKKMLQSSSRDYFFLFRHRKCMLTPTSPAIKEIQTLLSLYRKSWKTWACSSEYVVSKSVLCNYAYLSGLHVTLLQFQVCYCKLLISLSQSFLHTLIPIVLQVFRFEDGCILVEVYQRFRGPCCLHHHSAPW